MESRGLHRRRAHASGFTLVELLVTVAMIAILASIIFPIARAARENARRGACIGNLHQIAQLVEAYRQDYGSYPEMPGDIGTHGVPQGGITALALANISLTGDDFWCLNDAYEDRVRNLIDDPVRDTSDSSYAQAYNFYGYVSTTDGLPFAITTKEAAAFLNGNQAKTVFACVYPFYYSYRYDYLTTHNTGIPPLTEQEISTQARDDAVEYSRLYVAQNIYDVTGYVKSITDSTPIVECRWDLGLVQPMQSAGDARRTNDYRILDVPERNKNAVPISMTYPSGLFQGLANVHPPTDTIVTYCENHPVGKPKVLPAVTINGAAILTKPSRISYEYAASVPKRDAANQPIIDGIPGDDFQDPSPGSFCTANRVEINQSVRDWFTLNTPPATNTDTYIAIYARRNRLQPPTDWRIHKAPFSPQGGHDNTLYGDSMFNETATQMPMVDVYYRQLKARELNANKDALGYGWYDTGVQVQPGDLVMIAANAKWAWDDNSRASGFFNPTANPAYATLFNDAGRIAFTATGDPVEAAKLRSDPTDTFPGMLLPTVVTWTPNTPYGLRNWVLANGKTYRCIQAGLSGPNPGPTWSARGTVVDNTVKWQLGTPPPHPHAQLIGRVGDMGTTAVERQMQLIPLGPRASYLVTPADMGPGNPAETLYITMNDTPGLGDFADNTGYCELLIAVYRMPQALPDLFGALAAMQPPLHAPLNLPNFVYWGR